MLHTLFSLASYSVLQRFRLLLEFIVITTNFKVPGKNLLEFVHIAKKNYSTNTKDPGHIDRRRKITAISLVNLSPPSHSRTRPSLKIRNSIRDKYIA